MKDRIMVPNRRNFFVSGDSSFSTDRRFAVRLTFNAGVAHAVDTVDNSTATVTSRDSTDLK